MRECAVMIAALLLIVGVGLGPFSAAGALAPAGPGTILDQWTAVKAPAAPALKAVTADPATTAFLVMDIMRQT